MRYHIRDVAKAAGVSVATVSRVLNNARHVAAETRKRVLETARRMSYYRDATAQRLAKRRSNLFGLIVSQIANPYFPEIIRSFEAATLKENYELLLWNTEYGPGRIEIAIRKMLENNVKGVAVLTSKIDFAELEELAVHKVAVVTLDRGEPGRYIGCIRVDYLRGASAAIDHLLQQGHRRFTYVSGPQSIPSAAAMRSAVLQAFQARDLRPFQVLEGNHLVDGGIMAAQGILAARGKTTAILCGNDLTAIGVIQGLEAAGVQVPGHVSVVGWDDIYFAHLIRPPLTTVRVPRDRLGALAFETLTRILRSKNKIGEIVNLPTELVVRESTGPVRRP